MKDTQIKLIVCPKYGSPDVLKLKEVDKTTPKDNEVLIRIYATSVIVEYQKGLMEKTPISYG
jgi:D-arabinose 1-dehydrogenase-like Zn-dependent alcohol dehydrogenase